MKKILTLLVATAIAFAVVGCSQPAEGDTSSTGTTGTTGSAGTDKPADDSGKAPDGGTKTAESH